MELLSAALIGALLFLMALAWVWLWPKEYVCIDQRLDLTEKERRAVKNQLIVLVIGIPVFILSNLSVPLLGQTGNSGLAVLGLLIGFAIVIYIAVSSMIHRVSIFNGLGSAVLKGRTAVLVGFLNIALVLIFLVWFVWLLLNG